MGYRYLSTSRGDGNRMSSTCLAILSCIDTYLPREGRETHALNFGIIPNPRIDTYLSREGAETETTRIYLLLVLYRYLSTSRGVETFPPAIKANFLCIDTYLPREGTETVHWQYWQKYSQLLRIATYLPREGPETHPYVYRYKVIV